MILLLSKMLVATRFYQEKNHCICHILEWNFNIMLGNKFDSFEQ